MDIHGFLCPSCFKEWDNIRDLIWLRYQQDYNAAKDAFLPVLKPVPPNVELTGREALRSNDRLGDQNHIKGDKS